VSSNVSDPVPSSMVTSAAVVASAMPVAQTTSSLEFRTWRKAAG
jgi:hypothetical protein